MQIHISIDTTKKFDRLNRDFYFRYFALVMSKFSGNYIDIFLSTTKILIIYLLLKIII